MLVLPIAWDADAKPTRFDSGRVWSWVDGKCVFVGTYQADSIAEVIGLAHLNAKVVHLRYGLRKKLAIV